MATPRGIDIRQSGGRVVFRVSLKDSAGAKVTSGTTSLRLYELQDDGTLKTYDWSDNTFKTTTVTTETQALTHRAANNGATNTGLWSYALTTISGFTRGGVYIAQVTNSGASPESQEREFQYGEGEGDLTVDANGKLLLQATQTGVTIPTVTTLTGHTPQTGDAYARLGTNGAGLTALGDTRLANLDATVSSRSLHSAADVWAVGTRTLTGFGSLVSDVATAVWAAGARTLTAFSDSSGITTLLDRLTAIRAGLLDNLNAAIDSRLAATDYTAAPTASAVADAVWDETAADHVATGSTGKKLTDAGNAGDPWGTALPGDYGNGTAGKILGSLSLSGIAAAVWAWAVRTLTSTAAETVAAVTGATLNIQQGDDYSVTLTGLGNLESRTKLYFTLKASARDADSAALIQIEETAGLLRIARGTPTDATLGSLTVNDAATGSVIIRLRESQSALLPTGAGTVVYDIKRMTAGNPRAKRITAGTATITEAITRAVE